MRKGRCVGSLQSELSYHRRPSGRAERFKPCGQTGLDYFPLIEIGGRQIAQIIAHPLIISR